MENETIVVQEGAVSPNGAASGAETPPAPTISPEMQAIIDKQIEERVKVETGKVASKFQSVKDKEVAKARRELEQVRREAEEAKSLLGVYGQHLKELDPDTMTKVELATYRERERFQGNQRQREETEARAKEAEEDWRETVKDNLVKMGLDPDDKAIDWADDAGYIGERQKRIFDSASKILKTTRETEKRTMQDELVKTITAAVTAQVKKELGVDHVSTEASVGKPKGKKPSLEELRKTPAGEAMKKFSSGEWSER